MPEGKAEFRRGPFRSAKEDQANQGRQLLGAREFPALLVPTAASEHGLGQTLHEAGRSPAAAHPMDTAQATLWGVVQLARQSHTTSSAVCGQFNEGRPSCLGSGVCLLRDNTMHGCLPVHLAKTISSPWTLGQPHPRPARPP